jgi:glucose/mannose-6-phosphate isomerase
MIYGDLLKELTREPVIEGGEVPRATRFVVGGMGGSALPANAARFLDPTLPLATHRDYDLPEAVDPDALHIAISDSGNTAETLSFAKAAYERGLKLAAIDAGGELANVAEKDALPFVSVPAGLQPRDSLFYLLHALLALIGREDLRASLKEVSFDADAAEQEAHALADTLAGALPLFYTARRNGFLAYVSKIHLNETAKMPAYANVFPELNHNEMQSFDTPAPEAVTALTRFVLLRDAHDDPRVARRMDVFAELMRERGRSVTDVTLAGATRAEQLARHWFVMHRTARMLAESRGVDPDSVPLVEDFKKRL